MKYRLVTSVMELYRFITITFLMMGFFGCPLILLPMLVEFIHWLIYGEGLIDRINRRTDEPKVF